MEQLTVAPSVIAPPAHYARYRTLTDICERKTIEQAKEHYYLYDGAAKTGLHLVGGPGSGKSRYLGRYMAWNLVQRKKPLLILDPTGGACDNLLDKIVRLPLSLRAWYYEQIRLVDAGDPATIVPTPLFTRHSDTESVEEIVNRILVVWQSLDPWLESAPVMGANSLEECGSYGGQLAVALGLQLDFVADLVRYTKQYEPLLAQVRRDYPDLKDAVHYFQDLSKASRSEREHNTSAFLRKARMLLTDNTMRATFSAPTRGVDWHAVVCNGLTVVVDFRHELDHRRRRFKLLWWLKDFMAFIKQRGMAGRDQEVTLIIDEVTQLLGHQTLNGESVLAQDMEELVSVFGRNYGVNVVIAHQGLAQVNPRIQNALMQMGSQMVGRLSNPEDALLVAKQFKNYDPEKVRKQEPVWMNVEKSGMGSRGSYTYHAPAIIDYRTTEHTVNEQYILFADRLRQLPQFQFLLRPAAGEGQLSDTLWTINVDEDPDEYPYEPYLAVFREQIRAGQPIAEVLKQIAQRKPPAHEQPQQKHDLMKRKKDERKTVPPHGTIGEPAHDDTNRSLPGEKAPSPPPDRADEDDPFR